MGCTGRSWICNCFYTNDAEQSENVLALTEHLCASDSKKQPNAPNFRCSPSDVVGISGLVPQNKWSQNDGALFHGHNLDVKVAESECSAKGAPFEVDLVRTTTAETDVDTSVGERFKGGPESISPSWPVLIFGKTIIVGNIPLSEIGDGVNTTPALVVAFNIEPIIDNENDCNITNLCLTNFTQQGTV